jgi:hypothetical protein
MSEMHGITYEYRHLRETLQFTAVIRYSETKRKHNTFRSECGNISTGEERGALLAYPRREAGHRRNESPGATKRKSNPR